MSVVTRGHGRLAKQRVSLTNLPPDVAMIVNDVPPAGGANTAVNDATSGDGKWTKDEPDFDTYQVSFLFKPFINLLVFSKSSPGIGAKR